jgi:hypothetical protein
MGRRLLDHGVLAGGGLLVAEDNVSHFIEVDVGVEVGTSLLISVHNIIF